MINQIQSKEFEFCLPPSIQTVVATSKTKWKFVWSITWSRAV